MADYVYRGYADLEALGRRVVEKAAEVTLWQDESFSQAQEDSVDDYTKSLSSAQTNSRHYSRPTTGDPEDPENVKDYVRSALADIPQYFTAFSVPDPDTIEGAITGPLYRTAGTLLPDLRLTRRNGDQLTTETLAGADSTAPFVSQLVEYITTIHMKHWTGEAANQFTAYCIKLTTAAEFQQMLAVDLGQVMDAHLELRRRQLTDVWSIGEKTIQTLDALDSWCARKKTSQNVLTVVGAIAAVVVVVSTEGIGVPAAVEGLQSLGAILGTIPDSDPTPADISGATVQAVISSMHSAIQQLHRLIDEQEQHLDQALQKLGKKVDGLLDKLVVPLPDGFPELSSAEPVTVRRNFFDR